eukprot:m.45487 g.45487  ORF g.45487 m.45487 type:complete len:744 (+) comp8640_c0_seq1:83-2314(+)
MSMFSSISNRLAGRASDDEPESDDPGAAAESGAETRSELLFRIQELTERNERLTLRFRDVVGAYKATLKEKEALEQSVAALTSGGPASTETDEEQAAVSAGSDTVGTKDVVVSATSDEGSARLRQQLDSLGKAMATLTKEKTSMESRFQADKKIVADTHRTELEQIRHDHDARVASLESTIAELQEENDAKTETVNQLSEQLRSGHEADRARTKEWERIRKQHMKELESAQKQREESGSSSAKVLELESRLQKAQDAELEALTQLSSGTAELKEEIASLEEELDAANKKLLSAGTKGDGKQVLVLKQEVAVLEKKCAEWQHQAQSAKSELAEAVRTAQAQIAAAATKVSQCMTSSDEQTQETVQLRVVQENRIAELSALVGKYESARNEDSARIAELQTEVDELREAVRETEDAGSQEPDSTGAQSAAAEARIKTLEETSEKLQELLRKANQHLSEYEGMYGGGASPRGDGGLSPLGGREGSSRELDRSRQTENNLRSELKQALREKDAAVESERRQWQARLAEEQAAAREKSEALEANHRRVVDEMSTKSTQARERTLQLIDDRNDEVRRLRKLLGAAAPKDPLSGDAPETGVDVNSEHGDGNGNGGGIDTAQLDLSTNRTGSGPLIHAALETYEKGKEAASMRREIRELQGSVLDSMEKATLLEEQSQKLKEEIRRLERNKRREGANLEYLKNVLVKFMCKEIGQDQMLLAIATILQFSPGELNDVKTKLSAQSRTWWVGS